MWNWENLYEILRRKSQFNLSQDVKREWTYYDDDVLKKKKKTKTINQSPRNINQVNGFYSDFSLSELDSTIPLTVCC